MNNFDVRTHDSYEVRWTESDEVHKEYCNSLVEAQELVAALAQSDQGNISFAYYFTATIEDNRTGYRGNVYQPGQRFGEVVFTVSETPFISETVLRDAHTQAGLEINYYMKEAHGVSPVD